MEKVRLGRTNLMVTRTAFGVLPLQRTDMDEAIRILRQAYEAGINFYDTARGYTDSEEKIGRALSHARESIIIATKNNGATRSEVIQHLETSLKNLRTDYVDIIQLHNPRTLPDPQDPESAYAGLLEARDKGMARFIGVTSHSLENAKTAVQSGLYDTLQYPLCYLSSQEDLAIIDLCDELDVGLIAMKPLSGGLITNARAAFAFFRQYKNVIPIWGIQKIEELEEFLELDADPPVLDIDMRSVIERDRQELGERFCRACGYCLPCPADIPIPMAARMGLLLKRMPYQQFLTDEWREKMSRIRDCRDCGSCREKCPYGLNPPVLLREMLIEYERFYGEQKSNGG